MDHNASELTLAHVAPLIPFSAANLSLWDILLPPFLIALSLFVYDLEHPPARVRKPALGHVYYNSTSHARFLPPESRHRFRYPLVQLGLDLDALEASELDLPYLFRFRPPAAGRRQQRGRRRRWWAPWAWPEARTLCSIRPGGYLSPLNPDGKPPTSIKSRLLADLEARGVDPTTLGSCYMVTMPSFAGFEGINPLTVHFCYATPSEGGAEGSNGAAARGELKVVVLEVHNTFGERHIYVFQPGLNEEPRVTTGYQHEWVFPRAFHVSPFNDRSGSYRVCLSDPFAPSSGGDHPQSGLWTTSPYCDDPRFNLKIVLLTASGSKKLCASLSGRGEPLTCQALSKALLRFPLGLLSTAPRILYQAGKLHFGKPKLDIYPRPEPLSGNRQGGQDRVGGVGWQEADWATELAKRKTLEYLRRRVVELAEEAARAGQQLPQMELEDDDWVSDEDSSASLPASTAKARRPVAVVLLPPDPSQPAHRIVPPPRITISQPGTPPSEPELEHDELRIHYLTPAFFLDLLLVPCPSFMLRTLSPSQFTLDAAPATTSAADLFLRVFAPDASGPTLPSHLRARPATLLGRMSAALRTRQLKWRLSFASPPTGGRTSWLPPPHYLPLDLDAYVPPPHPLDAVLDGNGRWWVLLALYHACLMEKAGYWVFRATGSQFVEGTEPWKVWARAVEAQRRSAGMKPEQGIGSVRRTMR